MELLLPLLIVFMVGMMFVSSRQRRRQQQQAEQLQNSIAVGDVVRMTSGISGTVVDIDDEQTIDVEIAEDVVTTWLRAAVREKLSTDADADADGISPDHVEAPAAADAHGSSVTVPAAASEAPHPPSDAVGGTPTSGAPAAGASRAGSETADEVSSPRSS